MEPDCKEIRKHILKVSHASGHGHIPTCFSVVECLWAVYETMKHDPKNPNWSERDVFVLSKGHAALALYCVLARSGYFTADMVNSFGAFNSNFGCHADRMKVPGVEASTGSLGHGIGLAVGMALAFRLQQSSRKAYTLIGDGESNEGTVWEALMVADNLGLNNLTVIYDNNMSHARGLQIKNPAQKFKAFGGQVFEVDGHDLTAMKAALQAPVDSLKVIVAHTIKGCGCGELYENHYAWHRRSPSEGELTCMLEELDAQSI